MGPAPLLVDQPEQVTAPFLASVLDANIDAVAGIERIGTGQMSRNYRLLLDGDGPSSIVIKVPADDAATRELGSGAYTREVHFYAEISRRIPGGVARCHHHAISDDGTRFLLVLDDLAPARQGDQITGCSLAEARAALTNLAGIHAALWEDQDVLARPELARSDSAALTAIFPIALDEFARRYENRLATDTLDVFEAFRGKSAAWSEIAPGPASLVHGDYRLDNLLFTDSTVMAVDWQTVAAGPPARDVAYFLGNSLLAEDRRGHEQALLEHYATGLAALGVDYGGDALRIDYARGAWLGPLVTVVGSFVATRTDRGDEMFIAMADRAAAQLADAGSVDLL